MKKLLKWTGIVVGSVVALVAIAAVALMLSAHFRMNKHYELYSDTVVVPADSASVARGRHLAEAVTVCQECHGEHLEGKLLFDEPSIATVYTSNLTAGRGGVGTRYTDADYARAIRHGVTSDGRGLIIMHADAYHNLSREDLGSLIAYVRSLPPVDNEVPPASTAPLGKIFIALGFFDQPSMPLVPAEVIDHNAPFSTATPEGETAAYGKYLVSIALCRMCHGSDLNGGEPIEEGAPPGPSILPYGAPGAWSKEQFVNTIRTGVTPTGRSLNPEYMPWKVFSRMSDAELSAIRAYIASLNIE